MWVHGDLSKCKNLLIMTTSLKWSHLVLKAVEGVHGHAHLLSTSAQLSLQDSGGAKQDRGV